MFIYKITNLLNGKIYIGQTVQTLEKRWKQHCKPSNGCTILKEAIKKYGIENFNIEEICCVLEKEYLDEAEKLCIKQFNCLSPNGYNIVIGGNKGPTLLGSKNPMYGKFGKLHPSYGAKRSLKTKKLMSLKNSGKNNKMYGIKGKDHPSSKKIYCKTLDKYFDSIQDACRDLNLDPSAVVKVLKNKRPHHKNLIFKYIEDDNG